MHIDQVSWMEVNVGMLTGLKFRLLAINSCLAFLGLTLFEIFILLEDKQFILVLAGFIRLLIMPGPM